MRLLNLTLNEFRNFQQQTITFRPRVNFLVGENGQGKTNLLEAIYLLCRGTSFRPADSSSLLRHDASGKRSGKAKIHGNFLKQNLDYSVDMTLEAGRKSALVNGKRANAVSLAAHFPVILFSPESLSAIKSGPDQRRQLIDEILMNHDPRQARLLREFQRALKARNRLLKNIAEGIGTRHYQLESLLSLNKIYFVLATHLSAARIKALKDLAPDFSYAMRSILDESAAEISVDYVISGDSAMEWSESEIFDALQKRHLELALQEQASGGSLVGPHKHDIKFLFAGNDSRFYCSQGQQRALILALKIAQIVYHHRVHKTYPVLLLDDVMSELDAKKRVNLMKFLEGIFAQILLTATDLTWPSQLNSELAEQGIETVRNSVFSVAAGQVGVTTV